MEQDIPNGDLLKGQEEVDGVGGVRGGGGGGDAIAAAAAKATAAEVAAGGAKAATAADVREPLGHNMSMFT